MIWVNTITQSTTITLAGTITQAKGSATEKVAPSIGALPEWGGGLNDYQDGLGHLFREELSQLKGAFACFWGV